MKPAILSFEKDESVYNQEIPQSHTADQSMVPRGRDT